MGEHAIWGRHNLFEEGVRSPLIIAYPALKYKGKKTTGIVETVAVFPTLCDLTGIKIPNFANGESLISMLENPSKIGHTRLSYNSKENSIRTDKYRMTVHEKGAMELYDHSSKEKESINIADAHPEIVAKLKELLKEKLLIKKN
ncbi:sulfatase/phosphatase domain-containing protein [Flavobacterium ovatum]|uniref:sulfatase/phosphatase domain-containing protein n=1 Tax=Flavobacterium ovatum TaxID=1928857 RepID=UPI00344F444C